MEQIIINLNEKEGYFVVEGNIKGLFTNKRLLFSLKRLGYYSVDEAIHIPFDNPHNKIALLSEIQEIMEKFSFQTNLWESVKDSLHTYHNEQENFRKFSEKARSIRNNEFSENPELINEFESFQEIIKTRLSRTLYDLQLLSAFHMAFSQNSCNFAVPWAGKTSIVYWAFAYLNSLPEDNPRHVDKILIIWPLSSFAPWESEYMECFGKSPKVQRVSAEVDREKVSQHFFSGNPSEITLISHAGIDWWRKEIVDFLKRNKTMVVVDEAHRIKNPDWVWGKISVEIAKEARSRIILTGTPAPNGYEDLFNLYQFIYPYKYKDIMKIHYWQLQEMSKNSDSESDRVKAFTQNISPYFIRIKKSDLRLPSVKETIIEVNMDSAQREIYDFIESEYIKSFRKNDSATLKEVLNKARLIRLRQAATDPGILNTLIENTLPPDALIGLSNIPEEFQNDSEILFKIKKYFENNTPPKFLEVSKLLSEKILNKKQKIIIWTIFIQNAKSLQQHLLNQWIESELLIWEVNQEDREKVIAKFNNPDNYDFQVVIANPFSVSESISLHKGCHNALYMERDYNCANFLQSKDRIHRVWLAMGQETNYYYTISKDSIDEVINERLDLKTKRMEQIIDQEIPLFSNADDSDESDLIRSLMKNYAKRTL